MENLEVDLVIIGGGVAGLAAAIKAVEKGAKVALFEKSARTGGCANGGMGPFAVESRLQRTRQYNLTREEAFKIFMDFTQWNVNARLVKSYIDKSAGTLDWLEKMGVEFYDIGGHGFCGNFTWHLVRDPDGEGKKRNTAFVMVDIMTRRAKDLGVRIFMKTAVTKILSEGARVTGVMAEEKGGESIQVKAKAVIIASGGYGAFFRGWLTSLTGDGLRMARELGAKVTEGTMEKPRKGSGPPPPPPGSWILNAIFMQPNLMVNLSGERFVDEEVTLTNPLAANAIARQKDAGAFMIFDEDIKNYYIENGFDFVVGFGMLDIGGPMERPVMFDDVLKELQKDGRSNVIVADSIEELAEKIGADFSSLRDTIEEYNTACETGRDHALNKKAKYLKPIKSPKFYARRCFSMKSGLPEGITINHRTEVLNEDFKAIPGLYAAGADTACNIYREIYVNVLPGNAMGWALNSGVMAAESALKYIKSVAG